MKSKLTNLGLILLTIGTVILFWTTPTNAFEPNKDFGINHKNEEFLSRNKILFYDPNAGDCEPHTFSEDSYRGQVIDGVELHSNQIGFVEKFHNLAESLSIEFGIPWEAVMAQGIIESGSGSSNFATKRNNFFGIGAFDSNPDNAFRYETPEKGWRGYYENIAKTSVYRTKGAFKHPGDPYAYISAIASTYASDPNYEKTNHSYINKIIKLAKNKNWKLSSELIISNPEMIKNAEANQKGIKPTTPSGGSAFNNKCLSPELKTGGMNLEEAKRFMEVYFKEADKKSFDSPIYFLGARISAPSSGSCKFGTMNNCSAFVQWFLNKYTTLGPDKAILRNGYEMARYYINTYNSITDGGNIPKPYAIMSRGGVASKSDGNDYGNHTAIVLGINVEKNEIYLGDASCSFSNDPYWEAGVKIKELNIYSGNTDKYGPNYAYLDNILNINK